jgi:hypothetical protein
MRHKDPNNFPSRGVVVLDSSNGVVYTLDMNIGNYFRINDASDIAILEPKNLRDGDSIVLDITTDTTNTVEFNSIFTQNGVSIGTVTNTSGWIILHGVYNSVNSKIEVIASSGIGITIEGDIKLNGNLTLLDTVWTDIRFPATTTKVGSNLLPHFDYTNIGLLFPQNDEDEKIYIAAQFGHDRKHGSSISPHIHYIQDEATVPVFIMEYRWYDNGEVVPASYTPIETIGAIFPWTSGSILQILSFPDIETGGDNVSSMMDIIIYRKTGDGVTGDVLVKEFDIHYQIDAIGSDDEYVK